MDRRKFIKSAGFVLPVVGLIPAGTNSFFSSGEDGRKALVQHRPAPQEPADYTIRIGTGMIEVGP